jgi:hypothetical protein
MLRALSNPINSGGAFLSTNFLRRGRWERMRARLHRELRALLQRDLEKEKRYEFEKYASITADRSDFALMLKSGTRL